MSIGRQNIFGALLVSFDRSRADGRASEKLLVLLIVAGGTKDADSNGLTGSQLLTDAQPAKLLPFYTFIYLFFIFSHSKKNSFMQIVFL